MDERVRLMATAQQILRRTQDLQGEMAITRGAIAHTKLMFEQLCTLADCSAEHLLHVAPEEGAAGLVTYLSERRSG